MDVFKNCFFDYFYIYLRYSFFALFRAVFFEAKCVPPFLPAIQKVIALSFQYPFLEFIYFLWRTIVEPPEVFISLDIPKVPFRLDGSYLTVQDSLLTLDVLIWFFLQIFPSFIDLHDFVPVRVYFRIVFIQTSGFVLADAAVCTSIHLKKHLWLIRYKLMKKRGMKLCHSITTISACQVFSLPAFYNIYHNLYHKRITDIKILITLVPFSK